MHENATVIRKGADLPPDLADALDGGDAEAFYAVRLEKLSPEETAAYLEARAGVQSGLADWKAGRVHTEDETMRHVFGEDDA